MALAPRKFEGVKAIVWELPASWETTNVFVGVVDAPEVQRMTFWTSDEEPGTEDLAAWLASIGSGTGTDGGASFDPGGDYQDPYVYGANYDQVPDLPYDGGDEAAPTG